MESWDTPKSQYDPEAVAFYDIAHEGAQLRIIAESVGGKGSAQDGPPGLGSLAGHHPRSLVIVAGSQLCATAARVALTLAAQVMGAPLPTRFPSVVTTQLPDYVGALDCVLVLDEHGHREDHAAILRRADARGATTVVVAPADAPVVADAPAGTVHLAEPPTAQLPSPIRFIGAVLASWALLAGADAQQLASRLAELAGLIDEELVVCSPEREEEINQARQLAAVAARADVVLHIGVADVPVDLVALIALLWTTAGTPAAALSADEWFMAHALLSSGVSEPDIFADPAPVARSRQAVLWGASADYVPATAWEHPHVASERDPVTACVRMYIRAFAATAFMSTPSRGSHSWSS